MSATELAVIINYVVSLQQKFDVLQHQHQQLQERVESLEGNSTRTAQALWSLQTGHADLQNSRAALQTCCTELRSDHEYLGYEVRFVLLSNDSDIGDMTAINPALKKTIVKRQLQMTAINLSLHKVFSFDHSCRDRRDRLG